MFDLAWSEIALIGVVALVVIGPKDLPEAIRGVARGVAKLRKMVGEFQGQADELVREANLEEVRNTISDIRNFNIRGEIEKAVDKDGSLRKTLAEDPLKTDYATPATTPALPAVPAEPPPAFIPPAYAPLPPPPPVVVAPAAPPPAFVPPAEAGFTAPPADAGLTAPPADAGLTAPPSVDPPMVAAPAIVGPVVAPVVASVVAPAVVQSPVAAAPFVDPHFVDPLPPAEAPAPIQKS